MKRECEVFAEIFKNSDSEDIVSISDIIAAYEEKSGKKVTSIDWGDYSNGAVDPNATITFSDGSSAVVGNPTEQCFRRFCVQR